MRLNLTRHIEPSWQAISSLMPEITSEIDLESQIDFLVFYAKNIKAKEIIFEDPPWAIPELVKQLANSGISLLIPVWEDTKMSYQKRPRRVFKTFVIYNFS